MKSGILVAKIGRAIETGGAAEDGASLAGQYAQAANALNARLDAVVALIDSKQVSDAVRIMEDAPRLLDEINALDFMRLPDWDVICTRNGWARPPKLDKTHIERVLLETGSMAAAESYLRMYRRAIRVNDQRLAVTSLRQLSKADHTKDWKENLLKAEAALKVRMGEAFRKAREAGDEDSAVQIARDFYYEPWLDPPAGKDALAMRAVLDEIDAAARAKEGEENVSIIAKMHDGDWDTDVAMSLLQAIDRLSDAGWTVPAESGELVENCRRRCADEQEAREREARWKACCEDLYAAVQREDVGAVREAMAAFGPLDREPEEDLLRKAQLVVKHDDEKRRRKMTLVTVCVVASLAAFLGISTVLWKQKLFNDRCDGVAAELETLATSENPIETLRQKLARLERDEPDVFADSRIGAYTTRLQTLIGENAVRTNELVSILGELEAMMQDGWKDASDAVVTGRIERAKTLVRKHELDFDYDKRLLAIRSSFTDFQNATETARREMAEQFSEMLLARLEDVASRLKMRYADEALQKEADGIHATLGKWRDTYAEAEPDLDAKVREVEARFAEAEALQNNLTNALSKLKAATSATEIIEARSTLLDHYGDFDVVKTLRPLPYAEADAATLLGGSSKEMDSFASLFKHGISDEEFQGFLKESVVGFSDFPSYYSLYGVFANCWRDQKRYEGLMIAMAKGRPEIAKAAKYKSDYHVSGDLIDFSPGNEGRSESSIDFPSGSNSSKGDFSIDKPVAAPLAPTREIQILVDLAETPGLTQRGFIEEILKKIDAHIAETRGDSYLIQESDAMRSVARGTIPAARRVQFLDMYVGWLRDGLKAMPPMKGVEESLRSMAQFAQPVKVEGVPPELTWACLYERRVRTRNAECAKFMVSRFPTNFTARFRQAVKVRSAMAPLSRMKVESAGKISFDPAWKGFSAKPNAIILDIPKDIQVDHPLYVLRKDKEGLCLKKAVIRNPANGKWGVVPDMMAGLLTGEPLFQISVDGKTVDFEKEVARIVGELPKDSADDAEVYLKDVPYFGDMRRK